MKSITLLVASLVLLGCGAGEKLATKLADTENTAEAQTPEVTSISVPGGGFLTGNVSIEAGDNIAITTSTLRNALIISTAAVHTTHTVQLTEMDTLAKIEFQAVQDSSSGNIVGIMCPLDTVIVSTGCSCKIVEGAGPIWATDINLEANGAVCACYYDPFVFASDGNLVTGPAEITAICASITSGKAVSGVTIQKPGHQPTDRASADLEVQRKNALEMRLEELRDQWQKIGLQFQP